jgi:NAD(P)-dependent dehydrogenase (short-subunit alcohol dehydrogenase family)
MAKQPQNAASRSALIIGGTGGIGRAVATALAARGWDVKALHREPERGKATAPDLPVAWVKGDAMNEAEVIGAADGARILFHGANPPGYRRWRELAIPMLANSIAAGKRSGSRLIFPGNVYNFGSDAGVLSVLGRLARTSLRALGLRAPESRIKSPVQSRARPLPARRSR